MINSKSDRRSHSILNSNSGIAVPKSERFKYPGESAKTKVSYHQGLQDFNFMNVHSGKYYKGASIGKGGKYDFTKERKSPGVGTYHIPSIFDK